MKNIYRKVGDMAYDGLITDIKPTPEVQGRVIAHGEAEVTYVRGTIFAKGADGKLAILGENPSGTVEEKFNGDASTKTFTLVGKPEAVAGVTVGGTPAAVESYNAYTGVLTLSEAPAAGTNNVVVTYENSSADKPDCILCDDITVGTTADEKVACYTAGCFDPDRCTVADGYTISEADVDELRMRNIIFKAAQK